jgi:hypothetical protein
MRLFHFHVLNGDFLRSYKKMVIFLEAATTTRHEEKTYASRVW